MSIVLRMAAAFACSMLWSVTASGQGFTPEMQNKEVTNIGLAEAKREVEALRKLMPKIIGGTDAAPGEFPHQVSLMFALMEGETTPALDRHFCGGSIIGDQWVMTAAHCASMMVGGLGYFSVGGGNIDLNKLEEYPIEGVWVHPQFDAETLDYDFAIIKVRTPFHDVAIDVVDKADNQHIVVGNAATITGWGVDETGNIQQILKKAEVKVVSRSDCNDANSYEGAVTARMICLGLPDGGKDTCQGDSGGPAITKVENGAKVLFGATSWGYGCAEPQKYGVYARLITVRQWIDQTVGGLE